KERKKEIKRLGLHLTIYLVVMGIFMLLYGFKSLDLSSEKNLVDKIVYLIGNGFFNNELASKISGIWTLVILVDSLYSLPRFVFFKKNSKSYFFRTLYGRNNYVYKQISHTPR